MSRTDAFRDYAIKKAPKQAQMVDDFTEESPFLAAMPVQESSDKLSNVSERILNITGADTVDYDAVLPTISAETELVQTDLTKVGGIIEVGEDKAKLMGGPQAYFAGQMPWIMRETGNAIEKSMIYNSYRAYAFQEGKLTSLGGTTGLYSILCINFVPGQMYGLVGKDQFASGKAFSMDSVTGGTRYKLATGELGFGMTAITYLGANLNNPRYISGLVNCEAIVGDDNFPTEDELSSLRLGARAKGMSSMYLMHPTMKQKIGTAYKIAKIEMRNSETGINTIVDTWDGIPIMETYNMEDGTEDAVVIS